MFEKTFTFWRRLIGTEAAPAPESSTTAAVEDDRRLWARHAADLEGSVEVSGNGYRDKMRAHVRDLSLGGANLLVDRPLPAGQMLSLELPAGVDEVRTVLGCVTRVGRADDGQWSLGLVFSRELSSDDLARFGADKVRAGQDDQRIWVRYDCALRAKCKRLSDSEGEPQAVRVLNISASGIGLALDFPVKSGSLLTLDLLDRHGRMVCTILACAVHTSSRAGAEYSIGCNFIRELTEEELQSLL
jgi:hypothetical protein